MDVKLYDETSMKCGIGRVKAVGICFTCRENLRARVDGVCRVGKPEEVRLPVHPEVSLFLCL